ncbi:MAG TPA: EamA family transporter [Kofleriaceae bacterium]|nr:EamA family transporter [Kofleriaceae bacterium]
MSTSNPQLQFRTRARLGVGLALFSAACFSTAGSFARALTDAGWSTGAEVFVRVATAAAILAIPAVLALRGRWAALRRNARSIVLYGVVTVALCQLCYFKAVEHLSVGVALLLEYLGIVLIVGWMWIRHGQRPRRLTALGSIAALLGLVLVIDVLGGARLDPIGVLAALGAAVGLATYFVLSSSASDELPPVALAAAGLSVGAIAILALGLVGALPVHFGAGVVTFAGARVSWVVPVGGMSVVACAIAYVAGIGAVRRLGPTLGSFIGLTEVIFAVLFAWAFLGQLPTALQLVGGALIVGGVALVRADELGREPPRAPTRSDAVAGRDDTRLPRAA